MKVIMARKVSIKAKEIVLSEPSDKDEALTLLNGDEIEECVVDSIVILETQDGRREHWNEEATMADSLRKAIRE